MKTPLLLTIGAAITMAVVGCAQFGGIVSLRDTDIAITDQAPEAKTYAGRRPGVGQTIARTFKEQPPLIPHAVENFDEITVEENQCLDCHGPKTYAAKKAPKMADGHLSMAAGGATVRMERYQCNTCHVAQVDAKPLVQNTFTGNLPASGSR